MSSFECLCKSRLFISSSQRINVGLFKMSRGEYGKKAARNPRVFDWYWNWSTPLRDSQPPSTVFTEMLARSCNGKLFLEMEGKHSHAKTF